MHSRQCLPWAACVRYTLFLMLFSMIAFLALPSAAATSGVIPLEQLLDPQKKDLSGEQFVRGLARFEQGDFAGALNLLAEFPEPIGNLGDYAVAAAAEAALSLEQGAAALKILERWEGGTPLDGRALGLRARATALAGREQDAEGLLRRYLDRYPNGRQASDVRTRLIRVLERQGKREAANAVRWLRGAKEPGSPPPQKTTPPKQRALQRAQTQYRRHRHKEVIALLEPLLRRELDPSERCEALFLLGHTRSKQRKHRNAIWHTH